MQSANHSASLRLTGGEAAREARGKCIAAPLNVERRGIYGSSSGEQPSLGRGAKGKTCRHEYRHGAPGDVKFYNIVNTLFSGHHSAKEGIDLPLGQHRKQQSAFCPTLFKKKLLVSAPVGPLDLGLPVLQPRFVPTLIRRQKAFCTDQGGKRTLKLGNKLPSIDLLEFKELKRLMHDLLYLMPFQDSGRVPD